LSFFNREAYETFKKNPEVSLRVILHQPVPGLRELGEGGR
jgi:hypothetical protein